MLSWVLPAGILAAAGILALLILRLHRKVKGAVAGELRAAEESPSADLMRARLAPDAAADPAGSDPPLTGPPVLIKLEDTFRKELERLTASRNRMIESSRSELLEKDGEIRMLRAEKEKLAEEMGRRLRELQETAPRVPTSVAETARSDQEKQELLRRIAELESLLSLTRDQMQAERTQGERIQEELRQRLAAEKTSVETELTSEIESLRERFDSEHTLLEREKGRAAEAEIEKDKLAQEQAAERALTATELKTLREEAAAMRQREKTARDRVERERQRMREEWERLRKEEKAEREALTAESESLKEKIRNLVEESALEARQREEEFRGALDRRSRELEETIRQLQIQNETRQTETLKFKKQLSEKLMTLERAKELHLKLREELLQKEQEIAAADKLKEELEKETVAGLSRKENEIARLQALLAEKERRIEIFEAELNSNEVRILDLEEKLKEAAVLVQKRNHELKASETEKSGRIAQLAKEIQRRDEHLEQYRRKIEQDVKESTEREAELMSLTETLKQKEDAVRILGDSARENEKRYHILDIQLKEREIELRKLTEELEEEQRQRTALQNSLAENEEAMQRMEGLLAEYQGENATFRTRAEEREAAMRGLEAELQRRIQESSVAASAVSIDGGLIQTLRKAIRERDDRIRVLEARQTDVESEREHVLEKLLQAKEEAADLRSRLAAEGLFPAPRQEGSESGAEPAKRGRSALSRLFSLKSLVLLAVIPAALVLLLFSAQKSPPTGPPVVPEKWEKAVLPGTGDAFPGGSEPDSVLVPDREPSGVSLRRMTEITNCLAAWVGKRERRSDRHIHLRDVRITPKEEGVEITLLEYQRAKNRTEIARKRLSLVQGPRGLEILTEEILPFRQETKPLS
jgi:hypothetical protein